MKIFIDAGHNYSGVDTGAVGNGLKEQDITFYIADKLRKLLVSSGHSVKMSRENLKDNLSGSLSESLKKRATLSNNWGAELFISIHCNAFNGKANGTETLVYSSDSESYTTAQKIQKAIVSKLGTVDRGVKERPSLVVLKHTKAPAILVETAFIDNSDDALLLKNRQQDFAAAIFEGVTGEHAENKDGHIEQTVMKLPEEVYVQEIEPKDFKIVVVDREKKEIPLQKYFNCGYFTSEKDGKTIPIGNLASGGKIVAQAKDNANRINLSGKALTTIYTAKRGLQKDIKCFITKTNRLDDIPDLCEAVSGVPIIVDGKRVAYDEITAEGYFGNELYDTWHGFLGIRHGKLVYAAMKCDFDEMCWALVALGIYDAIKLDGGGSFILNDINVLEATNENRRIHNVGVFV